MDVGEDAIQSVEKQLHDLRKARSAVFLDHLAELAIEVEGDQRRLMRIEDSATHFAGHKGIQFNYRRSKWHVEVKATAGEDLQFDVGITEIEAATRLARRGGKWRILRVRNALSEKPEFDWLPNPFEDGFKEYFRLHQGGMRVSYSRR